MFKFTVSSTVTVICWKIIFETKYGNFQDNLAALPLSPNLQKKDNDSDLLSLIFISYLLLQFGGILLDLT